MSSTPNSSPETKRGAAPTGHAKHGPSSLKHKEVCAHWRNTPGTNPAAEEGTMLHERLTNGILDGLEEEQKAMVKATAHVFTQYRRMLGDGAISFVERRVNVAGLTWGTADEIVINGLKALILDAKFGRIEVDDAEVNLQGVCYALGVMHEWTAVQQVTVVFVQPRTDMVSSHTFHRATDYAAMKLRVSTVIDQANDPGQPYKAQPDNCVYCGGKATCTALNQLATQATAKMGFEMPDEWKGENLTNPVMMARALLIADILAPWIDDVKAHAREQLLNGGEIPGYELGQRSAPRSINNPQAAWECVKDSMTVDQFMSAVKGVSVPELEKLFAATAPRGEKGQAKQILEDRLIHADALVQDGAPIHFLKKQKIAKALTTTTV